jgi:hypothetical protein
VRCGAVLVVQESRARHQAEGSMDLARTGLPIRNSSDGQPVVAVRQAQQHNTRIKLFIHQISFLSFNPVRNLPSHGHAQLRAPLKGDRLHSPHRTKGGSYHKVRLRAQRAAVAACRGAGRPNISPDDRRSTCPRSPRPPSPPPA